MSGRPLHYWKSLERLVDDPKALEFLEREFPEGVSELPEGVSRRTMLKLMGASLSLAGLAACRRPVEKIVPFVSAPEDLLPGIPLEFATTMSLGRSAYGLLVESNEGRPTKIEGNERHPTTAGSSTSWIQAAILDLYDPDRSRQVTQGGQARTWQDAVAAWNELQPSFVENGGEGLAVLTGEAASPTMARLAGRFRSRFPRARFVVWDPLAPENVDRGVEVACGRALQPQYHFARAEVVLSIDADPLLSETEGVRHMREFADGRRVRSTADGMSRLYAVESALSLTGANADHRLALRPASIAPFVAQLAGALARKTGANVPSSGRPVEGLDPAWLDALVADLLAHRGRCLIVAGEQQADHVHAAVLQLNSMLGNVGSTVSFFEPLDQLRSRSADFADLVSAMGAGQVQALFVLGGNPVYSAPADLDFAGQLAQVGTVFRLGTHDDETSAASGWQIPQAHFLEAWGDARAIGGSLSVAQPLIRPLFDGRSGIELLGLLANGEERSGYDLVRETWQPVLGSEQFEPAWERVLHEGVLDSGEPPRVVPSVSGASSRPLFEAVAGSSTPADLDLVLQASSAVYDGRFANVSWLQELPDPVTKLTWDNAALIAPALARERGLSNGQMLRITRQEREIEAPVWIVPGQAPGCVVLSLGYGRTRAGRVAEGCGVDAYRLRLSGGAGSTVTIGATGQNYLLAQTQDHGSMEGRPLVREANLDHYRQHPHFAEHAVHHPPLEQPFQDYDYSKGPQWGMSIDLNACTGCNACVIACQAENNVPVVGKQQVDNGREMHWLRIDRYFAGSEDAPQTVFQPVPCMHCENAPCEQVCPVAATVHDAEGLNTMVYNRCIGTRYCSNNCPYKVRRFNFFNFTKDTPELTKMAMNPDVTVRSRGVMEKCTYCTQRINAAKLSAKLENRELRDGDVRTACEQACPAHAIRFGDIRDPNSAVSRAKAQDRDYTMLGELNNRPRTTYLAKLRNPSPALDQGQRHEAAAEGHS